MVNFGALIFIPLRDRLVIAKSGQFLSCRYFMVVLKLELEGCTKLVTHIVHLDYILSLTTFIEFAVYTQNS